MKHDYDWAITQLWKKTKLNIARSSMAEGNINMTERELGQC